jgi:hypothetical protein
MYGDAGWRSDCQGSQADLGAPRQAPTRYAEVGNVVEVGDEKEAEEKQLSWNFFLSRAGEAAAAPTRSPCAHPSGLLIDALKSLFIPLHT